MNVLLGASVTAAGMAEDPREGTVARFRSLPMSRVDTLSTSSTSAATSGPVSSGSGNHSPM